MECNPLWRGREEVRGEIRELATASRTCSRRRRLAACAEPERPYAAEGFTAKQRTLRPAPPGSSGRLRLPRSGALVVTPRSPTDTTREAPPSQARRGLPSVLVYGLAVVVTGLLTLLSSVRSSCRRAPCATLRRRSSRLLGTGLLEVLLAPPSAQSRVPRSRVPFPRLLRHPLGFLRIVRGAHHLAHRLDALVDLRLEETPGSIGCTVRGLVRIAHDPSVAAGYTPTASTLRAPEAAQSRVASGTDGVESYTEQAIGLGALNRSPGWRCAHRGGILVV